MLQNHRLLKPFQNQRKRLHPLNTSASLRLPLIPATAAKIPGVRFQAMEGIGHFPFAENPVLFANYLLPILEELRG